MSLHIVRVRQPGVALFTAPFHRALFDTRHRSPGYVYRPNRSA